MNRPVTTQSEKANGHFQAAVKLLHTYAFPEALWSLREAQRLDPLPWLIGGETEEAFQGFKRLENLFRTNHSGTAQKYLLLTRARFLVDSDNSSKENRAVRATTIIHDNAICGAVAMDIFASGYDGWKRHDIGQLE